MLNLNNNKSSWFMDQLNLYQSANSEPESIKRNFIIRQAEFSIITQALLNKEVNDPLQHELILGRRGSGKSTLLKRIEIEITENKKLSKNYIPINLAEEQAGIYRLFDLWEQVIEELQFNFELAENKKDFADFETVQEYTRHLYDVIHKTCIKEKKRIVLLLDNFDRIVENFTDDGHLLRELLINFNDVQIIAGSTRMDEHFWRYDMPFYEFFRKHRLEALSREEMLILLNHWADSLDITELKSFIKNNPGKLENVRILTDGLPRTLQFFIQIVLQNSQSYGYDYLKKIMDNVTPLYQERLNTLPAQLRKIILEMAFIWEACTTKQLVEKTRMESKLVSANLKTLELKGVVDKIETSKKNHLYRISERFFNMWLIFTQGNPEQKRKAKCLTIFLENWYNANDFEKLANDHISLLKDKKLNYNDALIFSKAISQAKFISLDQRDLILELTESSNINNIKNSLIHLPKKSKDIFAEISVEMDKKNYEKAIEIANTLENEEDGIKFGVLGDLLDLQKKYAQAIKQYSLAIDKGFTLVLNNLANLYYDQKNIEAAEKFYLLAVKKIDVNAMYNLGNLYFNQKNFKNAEKYYLLAINNGNIKSLNNLANLYNEQKKLEEATKYYLLAIENGNNDAIFNLANLYKDQKQYADAEKYYLLSIKHGDNDAIYNLALMMQIQEKLVEAEKYYLLSIKKGDNNSLFNLANLYNIQRKFAKAEKFYLLAIQNGDTDAQNNLAIMYYFQNIKKENAVELLKQNKENPENLIIVEIWNGIFNDLENRVYSLIKKNVENKFSLIVHLLVHQQKNLVAKLFIDPILGLKLQEKYAVLYYVSLLITNHPNEENLELKIPPEIENTVQEILESIKEKEKFYGYTKG